MTRWMQGVRLQFSEDYVLYWAHLSRFTSLLIALNISLFFLTELVTRSHYFYTFFSLSALCVVELGVLIPLGLHRRHQLHLQRHRWSIGFSLSGDGGCHVVQCAIGLYRRLHRELRRRSKTGYAAQSEPAGRSRGAQPAFGRGLAALSGGRACEHRFLPRAGRPEISGADPPGR